MRSSVSTVFNVLDRAAHPFQFGVLELLPDECCAHLVVAEDGSVVALGGFVQLDLVVLDSGGLELLGDALLHIARRLPNLEKALVRLVVNRIGVDARPSFRLRREDFLDGGLLIVTVVRGSFIEQIALMPIGRIIDSMKAISFWVSPYLLVELCVSPRFGEVAAVGHECIHLLRRVLRGLRSDDKEARQQSRTQIYAQTLSAWRF